jgi:hypothetical protein
MKSRLLLKNLSITPPPHQNNIAVEIALPALSFGGSAAMIEHL